MSLTVLHVAYPLAPVSEATAGGAEQVLLTLDRGLIQEGHRSLVIAAAGSHCHGLLLPVEIPSENLDQKAKAEARRQFQVAISHALEKHRVDVVHMHGIDFNEYLPDCELPIVVSLHLPLSWYAREALTCARSNISLICVSESQARTAPPEACIDQIIPNGVEVDRFHTARHKSDYVLFMGRICPEKALHLAMEAAEQAGEKLLIAGTVFDYPEHREYFERCIRPRLGHGASFIGAVGGRRKAGVLAGAKCLLISSQASETSSLIAMEAMASGTPVVAWRSGALPEIVDDGRTGYIVSSIQEMRDAITRVHNLRGSECRSTAERRFSAQQMTCGYLDLYKNLVVRVGTKELQAA